MFDQAISKGRKDKNSPTGWIASPRVQLDPIVTTCWLFVGDCIWNWYAWPIDNAWLGRGHFGKTWGRLRWREKTTTTTKMQEKNGRTRKGWRKPKRTGHYIVYIYIPVCGQSITCVCALSMHGALFPIINNQLPSLQIFAKRMLTIYQTDIPYSQPLYLKMIEREDAYPDLINAVAALRVC